MTQRWKQRPPGSNWGEFGPDDQRGRMNYVTREKVLQGVAEVTEGISFCLSLPLDYPGGSALNPRRGPPRQFATLRDGKKNAGRQNFCFPLAEDNPDLTDVVCDDLVLLTLQYSTQWDSFAHIGSRFDAVFDSRDAAYYGRLLLGSSGAIRNRQGPSAQPERSGLIADFALEYGLPGKPGYSYHRPFDYFEFRVAGSTGGGIESLETRGLLYGTDYAAGGVLAGIWGLYGSYDYDAPQLFRVSSTALSLGTTAQLKLPWSLTLQGSALAGVGYAAAGTLNAPSTLDYHYGVAPQVLAALRLVLGNRAALDVSARQFFVGGVDSPDERGHDNIERADVTFTLRVHGRHGIALTYLWSQRKASLPGFATLAQERGTLGIFYTLLGKKGFGVAD